MRKNFIFIAALLFLAGCSTGETSHTDAAATTATKQEITVAVDQEMSSMDSALATDTYSITAINNVMEGLYRLTAENELELAGASELPEISEDGLTYKIKLNDKATWSDGTPVTAADYVFGWQKAVTPATQAEYSYLFDPVKNANAIINGKTDPSELGITAIDDTTLEIQLETAAPYFESLLAFPTFFPQNEAFTSEKAEDYAKTSDDLLYNGPFVLSDFDGAGTDTTWTYLKNEDYWNADAIKLETINNQVIKESSTGVNLFDTGEIDDVLLTGELAKQNVDNEAYINLEKAGTTYLSYNQTKAEFQNEKVRQAISLVIDRSTLVDQILGDGSRAPSGLVPSGMSFAPTDKEDFAEVSGDHMETDITKAQTLWQEAKDELAIDQLTINLVTYDTDSVKKVAEYLQSAIEDNLKGTTVDVSVVPVSVAIVRGQTTDFDLFLFGWTADYPDPSSFLELFTTDSPYNYGKYSNADYDALITKAKTADATDLEKRWDDFIQAEQLLMKEMAVSPVFQKSEARLRNPELKGVVSHSTGAQFDYKAAYLE